MYKSVQQTKLLYCEYHVCILQTLLRCGACILNVNLFPIKYTFWIRRSIGIVDIFIVMLQIRLHVLATYGRYGLFSFSFDAYWSIFDTKLINIIARPHNQYYHRFKRHRCDVLWRIANKLLREHIDFPERIYCKQAFSDMEKFAKECIPPCHVVIYIFSYSSSRAFSFFYRRIGIQYNGCFSPHRIIFIVYFLWDIQ